MENEKKESKPIMSRIFSFLAMFALMGAVVYAGVATYEVVMDTFFATTAAGIETTGFTPPASLIKGSTYTLTGSFDNMANLQHTIIPSVQFVSDTPFDAATEFGVISLDGIPGVCDLSTTVVLKDTLRCQFAGITLTEALGAAPSTGDIDLTIEEVPLMWDGSELGISMQYSK